MDSDKEIWKTLQALKLGSDQPTWLFHGDVQRIFERDHRLCLVARGLNPQPQNLADPKPTLPHIWNLGNKVMRQINDAVGASSLQPQQVPRAQQSLLISEQVPDSIKAALIPNVSVKGSVINPEAPMDQGIKRKASERSLSEDRTSANRYSGGDNNSKGLVVSLKPPQQP